MTLQEAVEFLKLCGNIKKAAAIERQLGVAAPPEGPESRVSARSSDGSVTSAPARHSQAASFAPAADALKELLEQLQVCSPLLSLPCRCTGARLAHSITNGGC